MLHTSASLSLIMAHPQRHLRSSHLSTMYDYFSSQRRYSNHNYTVAHGTSWYSGLDFHHQKQLGSLYRSSRHPTPTSSSRTSCFPRRGEMLSSVVHMRGGIMARGQLASVCVFQNSRVSQLWCVSNFRVSQLCN